MLLELLQRHEHPRSSFPHALMRQRLMSLQPLKNLQKERIDLGEYDFRTILVDPPRAGLDDATVKLAQELDRIVYISW